MTGLGKGKMNDELKAKLKFLHFGCLAENWQQYLTIAQKGDFSHDRLLKYIIDEEYKHKKDRACQNRLKHAQMPEHLVIETFPFDKQPKLNKKNILQVYDSFEYMEQHRNLIFIGTTGIGKTGLATSFLIQAINRGYKGRFIMFHDLIALLYKSVADHSEEKLIKKFLSYDCLLIDELGYVEVETVQVGLFFTLMQQRHRKKTTIITTNLGFSDWKSFLKNPQLTAALIDRLTEKGIVFNMKGCSSLRSSYDQL
jgi:DNA replication protein DnaC